MYSLTAYHNKVFRCYPQGHFTNHTMSTVSTPEKRVIPDRLGTPLRRIVASWEVLLFGVAVLIFIFNSLASPYFLDAWNLSDATFNFTEKAMIAFAMPSPFLALSGIEYAIGPKSILRGIDLTLEQGRIYGLVGPNGSGKSTLLKIIARQVAPKSGAIAFGGKPAGDWGAREFARHIAYMTKAPSL